jgi:hypothetical protein
METVTYLFIMAAPRKKMRVDSSDSRRSSNVSSSATTEATVHQNGKMLELLLQNVDLLIDKVACLEDKIESTFYLNNEQQASDEEDKVLSLNFLADVRRLCVRYTDIIVHTNK